MAGNTDGGKIFGLEGTVWFFWKNFLTFPGK